MNLLLIILLIILFVLLACLIGLHPLLTRCNKHLEFGGAIPNPPESEFSRIYEETSLRASRFSHNTLKLTADNIVERFKSNIEDIEKIRRNNFSSNHKYLKAFEIAIEESSEKLNALKLEIENTLLPNNFNGGWLYELIIKICTINMQEIDPETFIFMCFIIYDIIRLFDILGLSSDKDYLFKLITKVDCRYDNLIILLKYIYIRIIYYHLINYRLIYYMSFKQSLF